MAPPVRQLISGLFVRHRSANHSANRDGKSTGGARG